MWVVGVVMILIGSLGNNLGNNLVSLGHKERLAQGNETESNCEQKDLKEEKGNDTDLENEKGNNANNENTKDNDTITNKDDNVAKTWRLIGITTIVLGNLFTFASFGFAAQSLLASLESVQFVSNVVFVRYVHKETVTLRMVLATLSIVVGNTLVVIFSDHAAKLYTSKDLLHLYRTNSAYQGYLVVALFFWAFFHYIYTVYHKARVEEGRLLWKHSFLEPFAYAFSAGIIGTQAVLFSKCMSMLIQISFRSNFKENEFTKPTLWWILIVWICTVAYWLRRLDKGLELFPPLFIIPVLQVFFVFFAILCGGIYFEEFETFTAKQFSGFIIGVLMILGGVYGLAPSDGVVKIAPEEDEAVVPGSNDVAVIEEGLVSYCDADADTGDPKFPERTRLSFVMGDTADSSSPSQCRQPPHQQQHHHHHPHVDHRRSIIEDAAADHQHLLAVGGAFQGQLLKEEAEHAAQFMKKSLMNVCTLSYFDSH